MGVKQMPYMITLTDTTVLYSELAVHGLDVCPQGDLASIIGYLH